MEKETFTISIGAPRQAVWNALWNEDNYRQWTSAFAEGSEVQTDWSEGGKVLFLDGQGSGMVSRIAKKVPSEYMSFEHMGSVKNGVESVNDPADDVWRGGHENYTLTEENGGTKLVIDLESKGMDEKMLDYFKTTWPIALQKLKELAEKK